MRTTGIVTATMDRRRARRLRVKMDATHLLPGTETGIECVVRDISDTGAKVESASEELPDRFKMFVKEVGCLYDCKIVRRSGNVFGVKFLSTVRL